jgi:hypothetical protein
LKKEKPYLKWIITIVISAVITILVLFNRDFLSRTQFTDQAAALSDGFFVAGACILSAAALAFVSDGGFFDIFGYSFHCFRKVFRIRRKDPSEDTGPKTFFDYRQLKHSGKPKKLGHLWAVGGIDILASILFLLMSGQF